MGILKKIMNRKKKENFKFSVAISIYEKDNANWFDRAMESIIQQTICPNEIVLVIDGPIPEKIENIIEKYKKSCKKREIILKIVKMNKNKGLGHALKVAIENSSNKWIARMDSDDISLSNRFEQQIAYIMKYPDIDVIGGDITEFIESEDNIVGRRTVPRENMEIRKYLKYRCPMNHVTVMYKKEAVMKAGGYKDWFWNEDYYLWIRMLESGCKFANTRNRFG